MALSGLGEVWVDPTLVKSVITPSVVSVRSRYDVKTQYRLHNDDLIIRNLRISDIYVKHTENDSVHKVTVGEAYRPDVIAQNVYNDSKMAWVILSANNLKCFLDLKAEMIIRIPDATSLYAQGGVMSYE